MIRSTAKIFRNLARKFIQLQPAKDIEDNDFSGVGDQGDD